MNNYLREEATLLLFSVTVWASRQCWPNLNIFQQQSMKHISDKEMSLQREKWGWHVINELGQTGDVAVTVLVSCWPARTH